MDSFVPEDHKKVAMAGVGAVNIFAGILSTLLNFLRYAELMESHRLSEVQWSKFGRNIAVELALDPIRRKPDIGIAKTLLNWQPKIGLQSGLIKTINFFNYLIK